MTAVVDEWAKRISAAEYELHKWHARAQLSLMSGEHADAVLREGKKMCAAARDKLALAGITYDVARIGRVLSPYVEGVYELMELPAPRWSDPVFDTAREVAEVGERAAAAAERAATGAGVGIGAAVVLICAYLVWRALK